MDDKILQKYSKTIIKLKEESLKSGINEEEFEKIYSDCIKTPQKINDQFQNSKLKIQIKMSSAVLLILIILIGLYNYPKLYRCLVCNMQEYIYPALRIVRKLTIPLISLFPSLAELHQETCLIKNPYFTVKDMDCWPCSNINNVEEVHNPQIKHRQYIAPFIYLTKQPTVDWKMLRTLYSKHKRIFDMESPKFLINNQYYKTPGETFKNDNLNNESCNILWKINTLNTGRILRHLIPRPSIVPKFGQSMERFIIIDTDHKQFQITDTECNYSFLLSLSGKRTIILKPAKECKNQCKSLKIDLSESYLLWYNWWYWRPIVQQTTQNDTFIVYVGSYC